SVRSEPAPIRSADTHVPSTPSPKPTSTAAARKITIPVMGEGIRNAKVVALLKKTGDSVALDDPLCEVETDKAVYPIESSFTGTMGEWKTQVGDTVEIGQEIGIIYPETDSFADQFEAAAEVSPQQANGNQPEAGIEERETKDIVADQD